MKGRKFAAITGSLLVRRGEAGPADGMQLRDAATHAETSRREGRRETLADAPPRAAAVFVETPRPPGARPLADNKARHRITLRLTDDQFRRLGIAAAGMHKTMQDFLIGALDARVADLAGNELAGCLCLQSGERPSSGDRPCRTDCVGATGQQGG